MAAAFPDVVLRPGVEVLLGVGASVREIGLLDLDTGVVDFSFKLVSLDFDDGVLLEEAMDEGLSGASFFKRRLLSSPFSRGEWAGLPLGEPGSSLDTSTTKFSSLFSPSLSYRVDSLSSVFCFLESEE